MLTTKTLLLILTAITAAAASDFEVWNSPNQDCSGDGTTYSDSATACTKIDQSDITAFKVTALDDNCQITVYADQDCTTSSTATPAVNECAVAPGSVLWGAYSITC